MNNSEQSVEFQKLSPIICGECGGAVPLSEGDSIKCIYCNASVEVPDSYRRGSEAKARLAHIRDRAKSFLHQLGRNPGKVEVLIAKIPSYVFFVLLTISLIILWWVILAAEYGLSMLLGTSIADLLSGEVGFTLFIGPFFLFLALALVFYFLVRRRVFVARRLLSVLAAQKPQTKGGPATCRRCGAPFQVEKNELVAACGYCGTENFLQVPDEWLSETGKLSISSGRNVFWAEREYDRELNSSRQSLVKLLSGLGFLVLIAIGGFAQADTSKILVWKEEVEKKPRQVFALTKDFPGPEMGKPFKLHGIYRNYSNGHWFDYKIALKRNDRIKFTLIDGEPLEVRLESKMQPFWRTKEFGLNTPAEFVVEMGALYSLTLRKKPEDPLPTIKVEILN